MAKKMKRAGSEAPPAPVEETIPTPEAAEVAPGVEATTAQGEQPKTATPTSPPINIIRPRDKRRRVCREADFPYFAERGYVKADE